MNEKLYKANVQLVDDNRVLKEDKKILQRRLDKAIEYIKDNADYGIQEKCCMDDLNYNNCDELLEILKGEYKNE